MSTTANVLPMIDTNLSKNNLKPSPPTTPPQKNGTTRNTRNLKAFNGHNKQKKQKHPVVQQTYDKKINVPRYDFYNYKPLLNLYNITDQENPSSDVYMN